MTYYSTGIALIVTGQSLYDRGRVKTLPYCFGRRSCFDDLDAQRCGDLVAQLAGCGIGTHILDGLVQYDLALIQLDTGLLGQSLGNFCIGDGTEQTAVSAAFGRR